jgi:hypothetical protein
MIAVPLAALPQGNGRSQAVGNTDRLTRTTENPILGPTELDRVRLMNHFFEVSP